MFAITISEKGGDTRRLEFDKPEVTIGRVQGNDVVLPKGNVSKRHSRIVLKDGKYIVVDLKSTNGTYVNGRKITSPIVVRSSDKVYIGDFVLSIEDAEGAAESEPSPSLAPVRPTGPSQRRTGPDRVTDDGEGIGRALGDVVSALPPAQATPPIALATPGRSRDDVELGGESRIGASPAQQATLLRPGEPLARSTKPLGTAAAAGAPPVTTRPPILQQPDPEGDVVEVDRPASQMPGRSTSPTAPRAATTAPPRERLSSQPPLQPSRRGLGSGPFAPVPSGLEPTGVGGAGAAGSIEPLAARRSANEPAGHRGAGAAQAPAGAVQTAPAPAPSPPPSDADRAGEVAALGAITNALAEQLGVEELTIRQLADPQLRQRAQRIAAEMVRAGGAGAPRSGLAAEAVDEVLGAGPLDALCADAGIDEIRVPRFDRIVIERKGVRSLSDRFFSSPEALATALRRLAGTHGGAAEGAAAEAGERQRASIETRLAGGLRLFALVPPLVAQPAATIVRPRSNVSLAGLVQAGAMSQRMADLLALAVRSGRAILLAGGSSGGRRAVLSALLGQIDAAGSIALVGDVDAQGTASAIAVSPAVAGGARAAVAAALRLDPDRLVLGGDAAAAALDALVALPGTFLSVASASGADAVARLVAATRLGNAGADVDGIRDALVEQLHLVLTVGHDGAGGVHLSAISELDRIDSRGRASLVDVFVRSGDGQFAATGHVPAFAESAAALFSN